jgi:hypothetical protein
MSELRYTATENLSGCYVKIDDRVHGLFIAKRAPSRRRLASKWSTPSYPVTAEFPSRL